MKSILHVILATKIGIKISTGNNEMSIKLIRTHLRQSATVGSEKAKRFFKTEPGSYAAHDQFLGIPVPTLRSIAREYKNLSLQDLQILIESPFNEERLLALFILVAQYQKGDADTKAACYDFYMHNLKQVNNWNLVDSSAHLILGTHLADDDKKLLITLAKSNILWERRIAMIATWYFIRQKDLSWTFKIARILLHDSHDLMHKAVGWMLREAGKKDAAQLIAFLDQHAATMPRTMLRYAIERLEPRLRLYYLTS
jgi:3-methyladenine DNA glycosylase AlkD